MKFPKEARFSFGVCVRKNADGVEEGIRLPFFNYTGKKIVTMQRYEKLVIDELSRVNAIPRGEKGSWKIGQATNKEKREIYGRMIN